MNQLDLVFGALADPTRRAILARLTLGEATVADLASRFPMSLPAVSKHVKVLETAGLVKQRVDAQKRPCRLEAVSLKQVVDYCEDFRPFWEAQFDRLADYLEQIQAENHT